MIQELKRRAINKTAERLNLPVSSVATLLHEGKLYSKPSGQTSMPYDYTDRNLPLHQHANILLIQRAGENSVSLVAGYVKEDEEPRVAMVREVEEEINARIAKNSLIEIGSYTKIKGSSLANRIIYTTQVPPGTMMGLADNWQTAYADFRPSSNSGIHIGGPIDCMITHATLKTSNDEIKRLLLVPYFFLMNIKACHGSGRINIYVIDGVSTDKTLHPTLFFKEKILKDIYTLL